MNTIGERLKFLRKKHSLTMNDIETRTGISKGNYSKYENNKFKPSSDAIILLANCFDTTTDYILLGSDITNTPNNLTDDEFELLSLFNMLPEKRQQRLLGRLEAEAEIFPIKKENMSKQKLYHSEELATKELA
ncbi:helix-turn-helix domain-containing protein [Vallitalea guaymasensis]|uniref:helix-turn-helix domain-containing protein n=1 Tax=Vallitalea guaymasensis TaxID=1185412 RepID=UPI000DE4B064|nr:helix-turn-helix domain-containing protein [Vallitalea guaymasensis]